MEADQGVQTTPMIELDLRLLHYFVVLARLRHFGAAADQLGIAQPSLSRQIRRLEQQVGARLLDRGPRGTKLTEAGRVLASRARPILRAAADALAETKEISEPARLVVGYTTGLLVTTAIRELRARHPAADLVASHLSWDDVRSALLDHRVDVAVTRLPLRAAGLSVTVLYEEPRMLLVAAGHRLAGRSSVTLEDVAEEPIPRLPDEEWNAFWRVDPRPDGSAAPGGPLVYKLEDKVELIAAGEAVSIAPTGSVELSRRPDIVAIPLNGVAPAQVAVITRVNDHRRLLNAFCTIIKAHTAVSASQ